MLDRIEEIQSFLLHRDFSLARRRMLDLSLDTGDTSLLKESIRWSKTYNAFATQNSSEQTEAPEAFTAEAEALLNRLQSFQQTLVNMAKPLLIAKGISKKYTNGNFSLKAVSLQVTTGSVGGVVGENGNGKTTLLRCLAGQLAHDTGTLEYSQLRQPDGYRVKNHVAFIPQRIPRWFGLLKDNLHFSAALSGIHGEENHTMVAFMLERLNLSQYAHLTWNQISSGYRTRFEIARVLLQMPSLLILDEPLANLDINAQQTLLTDLRYLAKSVRHPMGILLSSQQLHEVEKIADIVYFIKMGNCLYNTKEAPAATDTCIIEIETTAAREAIQNVFAEGDIQVHFNGSYYTLTSAALPAGAMVTTLLQNGIPVTYFRDITHSTKRFF